MAGPGLQSRCRTDPAWGEPGFQPDTAAFNLGVEGPLRPRCRTANLPLGPERLSCSLSVRSTATSQESQPQEARLASCGLTMTATSAS